MKGRKAEKGHTVKADRLQMRRQRSLLKSEEAARERIMMLDRRQAGREKRDITLKAVT